MGIAELVSLIEMPPEFAAKLRPVEGFSEEIAALTGAGFEAAATALHEGLLPDDDGAKILSAMLGAAAMSEALYEERGIPRQVYADTMKAFTRFVGEHHATYGTWGFSTWWWAGRHTSLRIFRLGALEYELCEEQTGKELSIHIPSDADFSPASVDASLKEARAFFARYFPGYAAAPFTCFSWMLAPAFRELLPPRSNILSFAARFDIVAQYDRSDCEEFIFRCPPGTPVSDYPERTSLQRALKAYLLGGKQPGTARGFMKNFC